MQLVLSILVGIIVGFIVAYVGNWLGVPAPLPALAGFVAFLLVAFYGRTWFANVPRR